jgi:DNA-binding MarR family transcriptional regulator
VSKSATARRRALAEALTSAAQRNGTDVVMMHQVIAERVGLAVTDLRCLNILRQHGPTTPGELAAATGLTTGAITRMVDRLLAAGFVRRAHDECDRRRVMITAMSARMAEIAPHYEPVAAAFAKVADGYTDEQLQLIVGLFDRMHETSIQVTAQLRDGDSDPKAPQPGTAATSRRT